MVFYKINLLSYAAETKKENFNNLTLFQTGILQHIFQTGILQNIFQTGILQHIFQTGILQHIFQTGILQHMFQTGILQHIPNSRSDIVVNWARNYFNENTSTVPSSLF